MNILRLPPIDWILRQFFRQPARAQAQARDLQVINQSAEQLNKEALDVLDYQFGKE